MKSRWIALPTEIEVKNEMQRAFVWFTRFACFRPFLFIIFEKSVQRAISFTIMHATLNTVPATWPTNDRFHFSVQRHWRIRRGVQFLSISRSFRQKFCQIIGWRLRLWSAWALTAGKSWIRHCEVWKRRFPSVHCDINQSKCKGIH